MHDAVLFERRGRPAAVIITDPFVGAGRAMAALDGLPHIPMLTMPHPTAELARDDVSSAAARLVDQVAAVLLGHA